MIRRSHVNVIGLDHVVLRCADVATTLGWYLDRLGLEPVRVDEWHAGLAPFPSARVDDHTIIDFIPQAADSAATVTHGGNVDHVCLVITPCDLDAVAASGEFVVLDGPATRFGARGNGVSLYVRDPDGTTVELRYYPRGGFRVRAGVDRR